MVAGIEITSRDYNIGIDVIAAFYDISSIFHFPITSHGLVIFPVIALAAAVAGLARYTSESVCPIHPTKLRFVVVTAFSPAASIPM